MQRLCLSHSPAIHPSLLQRASEEPQKLHRLGVVSQPALDVPLGVLPGAERPADGVDPEVAVDAPPDLGDAKHGLEAWTAVTHRVLFSAGHAAGSGLLEVRNLLARSIMAVASR